MFFGYWFRSKNIYDLRIPINKKIKYNIDQLYSSESQFITYTRDEFGLRGSYPSLDSIQILTIGGSTTDQVYITDSLTWQSVLERQFYLENKKIYIGNAGLDGHSTFGHLKIFDLWLNELSQLKPNYFLFFIGVNDFHVSPDNRFDKMGILEVGNGSIDKVKILIKRKSAIYNLYLLLKKNVAGK